MDIVDIASSSADWEEDEYIASRERNLILAEFAPNVIAIKTKRKCDKRKRKQALAPPIVDNKGCCLSLGNNAGAPHIFRNFRRHVKLFV